MPSNDRLDHTVINVKYGMDEAMPLFKKLGFFITPRGFHSHGSMNHLMVFENDYLELIGIPKNRNIERQDLSDAPIGINGIVFKAIDIEEIYSRMKDAEFDAAPPKAFHRPVKINDEQKNAKFQTATVRSDVFGGGRVYFCQHDTPDLVWRPEWQKHLNGVSSVSEIVTVACDTDGEAQRFGILLKTDVTIDGNGALSVNLDNCRLTILTPDQYTKRYGKLALKLNGRRAIFGAIVLATKALPELNKLAKNIEEITTKEYRNRTIIGVPAYDTVLEFVNQATI